LAQELLAPERWPLPNWYEPRQRRKLRSYEEYMTHKLRSRYMEQENDFRAVFENVKDSGRVDLPTAKRVFDLLHQVRESLEQEQPDLLTCSSALDLAERYMVWLYPPHVAMGVALRVMAKLEPMESDAASLLMEQMRAILAEHDEQAFWQNPYLFGRLRSLLNELISTWNESVLHEQIGNALQLRRLRALRWGGIALLAVLLLASPLLANSEVATAAPVLASVDRAIVAGWITGLAMTVVGALGGFLSGLLQVRSARVTLAQYQDSMLKLQLKPIVGGLAALLLYTFLSWDLLPGIVIENAGSYVLIGFLAGFSERFFLRLLELGSVGETEPAIGDDKAPET
jgi:hypothetical protein